MKVGLTLGKYSPLHSGHESIFKRALNEMDHLIVVIYNSPETTNIPLSTRADWIRTLYPQVEVLEAWDGPTEVGNTDKIKEQHEHYLLELLKEYSISTFYTAEFYGEHVSMALKSDWCKINRETINISGSLVRSNPFQFREWLNPYVYKDYVLNIVFLGAPSTGKTTICEKLAGVFNTNWMPEYGREYWEKHNVNRRLTEEQLFDIAEQHLVIENSLLQNSNQYLFTDTNALTTYMFSKYYHKSVSPKLVEIAELAEKRYDIIFLCDTDIPYADTWDRSGDMNRIWFQQQIEADLKYRKLPYIKLSGSIESRITKVTKVISNIRKYDNIWDKILEA